MNPTLNWSSAIRRFEGSDVIEIRDGITFDFYTGLSYIMVQWEVTSSPNLPNKDILLCVCVCSYFISVTWFGPNVFEEVTSNCTHYHDGVLLQRNSWWPLLVLNGFSFLDVTADKSLLLAKIIIVYVCIVVRLGCCRHEHVRSTSSIAGLQYAEEVGLHVDPNPQYTCTLCSVTVDAANHHLHFTSSAHRLTVLVRGWQFNCVHVPC